MTDQDPIRAARNELRKRGPLRYTTTRTDSADSFAAMITAARERRHPELTHDQTEGETTND